MFSDGQGVLISSLVVGYLGGILIGIQGKKYIKKIKSK